MPANINWIDVLNDQATWSSYDDLVRWLANLLDREPALSAHTIEDFQSGLNNIRRQVSLLHFHEPIDIPTIDTELKNIRLELMDREKQPSIYMRILPSLHARLQADDDDSFVRALKETLIVQFAQFVAETLKDADSPALARCEGLYREADSTNLSPAGTFPAEIELRWRKEITVLTESGLESSPEILRCADFFPARAKGRFCSDECRFRTFQLTKQLSDPGYLAAKQKRYRARQDRQKD